MKKQVKSDIILKNFWRDNHHFADLFNTVLFQGHKVLKPESLEEQDTDVSGVIELKDYKETIARMRDVVKKTAYGIDFVIYGLEGQKAIHYGMPLRNMIYDSLGYLKEYQEIAKKNRLQSKEEKTKMSTEEFLSGIKKEDRLHPIVTLVVYYGEKPWDGPLALSDMIEMPDEVRDIFADYKMNLIQVRESDAYTFQDSEVEMVFSIARDILKGNFQDVNYKYAYRNIRAELAMVIAAITNSEMLMEQARKEEEINMCTALEKLMDEGRVEGRAKGRLEIISGLLKHGLSPEEIQNMIDVTEEEIKEAKEMVQETV